MSSQSTASQLSLMVSKGQARPSSEKQFGGPSNTNFQYRATKRASDDNDTHGYLPSTGKSFGRKLAANAQTEPQKRSHGQPASLGEPHIIGSLIKRREESKYVPEQYAEDHMAATKVMQPEANEDAEVNSTSHPRRKMTVRIQMAQFETIDKIAAKTGRTYQDIQSAAIGYYLDSDFAEIEHGYESILATPQ